MRKHIPNAVNKIKFSEIWQLIFLDIKNHEICFLVITGIPFLRKLDRRLFNIYPVYCKTFFCELKSMQPSTASDIQNSFSPWNVPGKHLFTFSTDSYTHLRAHETKHD